MISGGDTIWELVRQASETLPEPFSRAALVTWISKRRPDVELTSISTHIQYAIAEAPNRQSHYLGTRPPLITRVDRGLYRRYRPTEPAAAPVGSSTPTAALPETDGIPVADSRIILVGCSRTKASAAMPAKDLFRGQGFTRARDYAIHSGAPWFVLSAKFGLLDPADVVGPYDLYLRDQPPAYRSAWGEWVGAQLALRRPLSGVTVEIHASEAYSEPLREPLRRLGAVVSAPLQGLRQGERLAWPGYRSGSSSRDESPADQPLDVLLDPANALRPSDFLAAGSSGRDAPGLYTWWIDADGAADLSRGMGHAIAPGLLYAGKAGGHRANAAPSASTLWGRIAGNHLRGNIRSSTFRKSLAALLASDGRAPSEEELTEWMHRHLRVAVLPVTSEQVASREAELVERADPPLNLAGAESSEARSTLSRLRGLVSRRASGSTPLPGETPGDLAAAQPRAFEQRIRADLAQIVAAGYRPAVFQRMLDDHGAVETARRLLAAPHLSDGFQYLWQHGLLHHSIEAAVLDPAFAGLFTDAERDTARFRLRDAGYPAP